VLRVDERIASNRANWDDRAGIHLASRFYDVEGWLRRAPGPKSWEVDALGDVSGLRLLHLQCHIGLDTLAWARVGAQVTGLDFSPAAIVAARGIAERAGLAARASFICADVYAAVEALERATFDVVYVSLGALCWLPSVDRWAEQVGALVSPGGRFYIHDGHPLAWALADDRLSIEHTYFEQDEPCIDDSGLTYTDAERLIASRRSYEWNHGVGEIVTALIRHGLRLEWIAEHDWTIWPRFPWLVPDDQGRWVIPAGMPRVPLTFSLVASRPASSRRRPIRADYRSGARNPG
jgi:SAM-dependent methyltransferase